MNILRLHRLARFCRRHHVPLVSGLVRYALFFGCGCILPDTAEIGDGTTFAYGGQGVHLHPDTRIGKNVVICEQVTIGGRAPHTGAPVIEDECRIGVGARILGPITIGRGSAVGANAVVLEDVPPGSVVAGVPGRVVRRSIDIRNYA